jgi:hypothetical protein
VAGNACSITKQLSNRPPPTPSCSRRNADIPPSRYERIDGDGYLTLDAYWVIPALLRSVAIEGRVLEPAAECGHLSLELRRAGLDVAPFDLNRYADPLAHDIGIGDIGRLATLAVTWVVTNLPYSPNEGLRFSVVLIPEELQLDTLLQQKVLDQGKAPSGTFDFDLPNRLLQVKFKEHT